jgi:hypothetical protein
MSRPPPPLLWIVVAGTISTPHQACRAASPSGSAAGSDTGSQASTAASPRSSLDELEGQLDPAFAHTIDCSEYFSTVWHHLVTSNPKFPADKIADLGTCLCKSRVIQDLA